MRALTTSSSHGYSAAAPWLLKERHFHALRPQKLLPAGVRFESLGPALSGEQHLLLGRPLVQEPEAAVQISLWHFSACSQVTRGFDFFDI